MSEKTIDRSEGPSSAKIYVEHFRTRAGLVLTGIVTSFTGMALAVSNGSGGSVADAILALSVTSFMLFYGVRRNDKEQKRIEACEKIGCTLDPGKEWSDLKQMERKRQT